jgi:putative radical SAM enzyme (TIGR03279 family)
MAPRADYGSTQRGGVGGLIAGIAPASPAARAGLVAGDRIDAVDGQPLADILDWQWHTDSSAITLAVASAGGATARQVPLSREPGEQWGIRFESPLFDSIHTCQNACVFCFMTQLPRGLRPALYVRDDDFRLSFLDGNFITLTNLSDADVERISTQSLSPLYVSLHAVDPDVRARLLCAREDRALDRFDELLEGGIDLHVQVVLVPGVNDGAQLDRTLTWLAEREGVLSVGVVPLGYTDHQDRFSASYETPESAAALLDQLAPWQEAFRARDGLTWVYAADEFYLNAGRQLPEAAYYDGFPQYENGIGLVRSFLDEFAAAGDAAAAPSTRVPTGIVTGTLFAPVLERLLLDAAPAFDPVRVIPVHNRFFGGNVSVTGLLTATDIARTLAEETALPARVLVPDVIFNADGLTLDGADLAALASRTPVELGVVSCDAADLLEALLGGPNVTSERS